MRTMGKFELNSKTYDVLKWLVWVFLPAFTVLIGGLGELFQWVDANVYTTVLSLVTVFLGSITGLSNRNYNERVDE